MTVKPRTVDNLGTDASIRYAKDQQFFEARYIEESRLIPQKAEVSVATPLALSEFEQTFSLGKTLSWALFSPPPNYAPHGAPLFSYQLIPSLGGYEKLEADADKLEAILSDEQSKREKKDRQSDQGESEQETERKLLASLILCINQLDKTLMQINGRRNQYQRG